MVIWNSLILNWESKRSKAARRIIISDIRDLLNRFAEAEQMFRQTTFLAPCVRGGQVRARVAGLVHTFTPRPTDFEGWAVFQPLDEKTAEVVEEADLPFVAEYLRLMKPLRLRLAHPLHRKTWLAYPVNESDAQQRTGSSAPVAVHLVTEGARFEQMIARSDGGAWWFEETDRRADPLVAEQLRDALSNITPPEQLGFKGITPEMRTVYDLAVQQAKEFAEIIQRRRDAIRQEQDETRLTRALEIGGGQLRQFTDRGDFWLVEWITRDGERHTSAIGKRDLTVISAGICLSGQDRDFDLQSLVGVIEKQWY